MSVSAQVALPDWVRGRGLALYTTVFFGCLTLGSAVWGEVAALVGLFAQDRGPVLVTVEYCIRSQDREAFLEAMAKLEHERRRDGAYRWSIFEDAAEAGRIVETFLVESWMEHLRQHERVTNADRVLQEAVQKFHLAGAPKVTHLIAAEL